MDPPERGVFRAGRQRLGIFMRSLPRLKPLRQFEDVEGSKHKSLPNRALGTGQHRPKMSMSRFAIHSELIRVGLLVSTPASETMGRSEW